MFFFLYKILPVIDYEELKFVKMQFYSTGGEKTGLFSRSQGRKYTKIS